MANLSAGLGAYLQRAFLYRWNLLVFLGATAAAAMSPIPDVLLPLIAAGELTYLTALISNAKFRQAIDAEHHQAATEQSAATAQRSLQQIVATFPFASRQRFEQLRNRCLEMRDIAHGVRGRQQAPVGEDSNTQALDRMLWVFLRLQTTQLYLQRFLEKANEVEIRNRIRELRFHAGEMTQADLAARIGMTRQTIVAMEQGKYSPSLEAAFRIAAVFGVPITEVFQWDEGAPDKA